MNTLCRHRVGWPQRAELAAPASVGTSKRRGLDASWLQPALSWVRPQAWRLPEGAAGRPGIRPWNPRSSTRPRPCTRSSVAA